MYRLVNPRFRRSTAVASAVAILCCVLVAVPAGAAAHPLTAAVGMPLGERGSGETVAGFPARSGYSAAYVASVSRSTPASVAVPVDVVFAPRGNLSSLSLARGVVPVGEYARSYGLTPAQYASAEQYFVSFGITVRHLWPDRLVLSLQGNPAALDAAFHTSLRTGTFEGRTVLFPSTPPSLPAGLEAEVAGVVGLSTGFQPFSISLDPATPVGDGAAAPSQLVNNTVTPNDARAYYNISTGSTNATAEGIALILWGAGYDPSDVQSFYANDYPSNLPGPRINPYPIDGAPPPSAAALSATNRQAVQELTLDIEWSGSFAPGVNLSVIYPPGPSAANLTDALEKALSLPGIVAISMSFGAPEASDSALASSWGALFNEATSRRITLLAASGDYGGDANASCSGGPAPSFPASAPQVIAVGGTDLTPVRSPFGSIVGWNETGWSGSGGGYSALYAAPAWQKVGSAGTEINASGGGRGLPDVSATAVNDFIYFAGANQEADGTSFATPLWAGIVADLDAEIGSPLGFFTDRLYHVAADQGPGTTYAGLREIRDGQNCVANAAESPGWNAVTGWGSPQAELLYYELVGSFVNLTIHANPSTIAPGGTVSVGTEVTNWTTGEGVSDAPVSFTITSDTSVGPCTGVFDTVTTVSNLTGAAQATLEIPFCYLGAHAILQVQVTTPKLFGMDEVHVPVNLLGFLPVLESFDTPPASYLLFGAILAGAIALGGWIGRRKPPLGLGPTGPPVPAGGAGTSAAPSPPPPAPGPSPSPGGGPPVPGPPPGQNSQKT